MRPLFFLQSICESTPLTAKSLLLTYRSINHAHTSLVFSTSDHVPTLLKLAPKVGLLKVIVVIDTVTAESGKLLKEWSESQNVTILHLSERE